MDKKSRCPVTVIQLSQNVVNRESNNYILVNSAGLYVNYEANLDKKRK